MTRDALSGTPRRPPKKLSDRDFLRGPGTQHDPHVLQRFRTLPHNPKRESGRSVDLVQSLDGRGQSTSSTFGCLDRVHDGTSVGILDGCVEDIIFFV